MTKYFRFMGWFEALPIDLPLVSRAFFCNICWAKLKSSDEREAPSVESAMYWVLLSISLFGCETICLFSSLFRLNRFVSNLFKSSRLLEGTEVSVLFFSWVAVSLLALIFLNFEISELLANFESDSVWWARVHLCPFGHFPVLLNDLHRYLCDLSH